ncbi:transporter substrate-binding domain-containing protein [Paenibacillus ottowii]
MKKSAWVAAIGLSLVLLTGALSGCSSKEAASGDKVLYVGTQNDYPPFAFTNDKNELTGYDVEVIKEIDKKLDGYKIEFVPSGWDAIFLALDANKVQIIADEVAKNPEREKKYLFSDESYFSAQSVIIVKKGRTDIHSLKDLEGKKVAASVGDSYTQLLEQYNAKHGNKIILKYNDTGTSSDNLQDVQNGRVDAYVNDPVMTAATIKKEGLQVEAVGEPVQSDSINLVFKKDKQGEELKAKIDPIIKELKADGTLKKLSEQWTGGEFIPQ